MSQTILNLDALQDKQVEAAPFPHICIDNFLNLESQDALAASFPKVTLNGSVPLQQLDYGGVFAMLMQEMQSDALRELIAKKFTIDLTNRPPLVTVRGNARQKDGRIHTDTKSKLMTILLYLNPTWESEAGRLRLLRNGHDIEAYDKEIAPTFGRCLIFKVTPDCWHGHKPYVGQRRAIQLNYVVDESAVERHLARHNKSAKWKRFWSRFK